MEYAECHERAKCFLQTTDKGHTCCKILLAVDRDGQPVNYPDGKCPFYKRDPQDKPRRFGAREEGGLKHGNNENTRRGHVL